jgi:hypothetical protein
MTKIDLRKLEPAALLEKKEQVLGLKQKGYSGKQIKELTLVSEWQVSKIWRAFSKFKFRGNIWSFSASCKVI